MWKYIFKPGPHMEAVIRFLNFIVIQTTDIQIIKMEKVPVWLTADYVGKIMRKYKNTNNIQIINMQIKPATAKGENYSSIMTRLSVDYMSDNQKQIQQAFFIVKSSYEGDDFLSNIFNSYKAMETEMCIYERVLPALSDILLQIGEQQPLFAKTVFVDYEYEAIILQDLMPLKYSIGDRLQGFSLEQAMLVMQKIAKMHAAAVVLDERCPHLLRKFIYGLVNEHSHGFMQVFRNNLLEVAYFAKSCDELGSYYYEKLLQLEPFVKKYSVEARKNTSRGFSTLIHGDLWLNNILLSQKSNQQQMENMILIDFQFSAWAPATTDLHYFLNTSMSADTIDKYEGVLLQQYQQTLKNTFLLLKYQGRVPTLHEIWLQYEETRFIGLISALSFQPIMINPHTEDADAHALIDDDERARKFRKQLFQNPVVQNRIKKLLPMFDERGLLDVPQ